MRSNTSRVGSQLFTLESRFASSSRNRCSMIRNGGPQRDRQMAWLHSHKGVGIKNFLSITSLHSEELNLNTGKCEKTQIQEHHILIWMFPKIVVPPNHPIFHYKPSILGYPYFWKHPYILQCQNLLFFSLDRAFGSSSSKFSGFRSSQCTFWIRTSVQLFFQNCRLLGRVFSAVLLQYDQFHLESQYC